MTDQSMEHGFFKSAPFPAFKCICMLVGQVCIYMHLSHLGCSKLNFGSRLAAGNRLVWVSKSWNMFSWISGKHARNKSMKFEIALQRPQTWLAEKSPNDMEVSTWDNQRTRWEMFHYHAWGYRVEAMGIYGGYTAWAWTFYDGGASSWFSWGWPKKMGMYNGEWGWMVISPRWG